MSLSGIKRLQSAVFFFETTLYFLSAVLCYVAQKISAYSAFVCVLSHGLHVNTYYKIQGTQNAFT